MSRSDRKPRRLLAKCLCTVSAATMLTACGSSTRHLLPDKPSPLVIASCPTSLVPLTDDSFGATTLKLIEVSGIYYRCIEAVGLTPKPKK